MLRRLNLFTAVALIVAALIGLSPAPFGAVAFATEGTLELKGRVEVAPAGRVGAWRVAGTSLTSDNATLFRDGVPVVGDCVEVGYDRAGGQNLAREIKRDDDCAAGGGEQHEVYAVVEQLPGGAGLVGNWTIGGAVYQVTAATALEDGPFAVGTLVEVHYTRAADGTRVAQRIEGKAGAGERGAGKARGRIAALPGTAGQVGAWVVGGTTYRVSATTRLEGGSAAFAVGTCVEVQYQLGGGERVASSVAREGDDDCAGAPGASEDATDYGFVTALPTSGFLGAWTIGGAAYSVVATTTIAEEHGGVALGAFVAVEYQVQGANRVARRIETLVPPGAGERTAIGRLRSGVGTAATATLWYVDGVAYRIAPATLVDQRQGLLAEGQPVLVNATRGADGVWEATQVRALSALNAVLLPLVQR